MRVMKNILLGIPRFYFLISTNTISVSKWNLAAFDTLNEKTTFLQPTLMTVF